MISIQKERKLQSKVVQYVMHNVAEEVNSSSDFQFEFNNLRNLFGFGVDIVGVEKTDEGFSVAVKLEDDKKETFRTFFIKKLA